MRQMVNFTLSSAGHTVIEAGDAEEAIVAARGKRFDLVISDVNMPGRSGLDMLRELR